MPDSPVLIDESHPGVIVLTLNRPERRNALNAALLEAICKAVASAEADKTRRVMILRGAGAMFCSGLDLKETMDDAAAEHDAHLVMKMLHAISRSRLITIAAVHGAALAGGAGLMAACDFAIASDKAYIAFPEVHRGLVPAVITTFLLRVIAGRHVRALLLGGQPVDAQEAARIGLINRAVPAADLQDAALQLAGQILLGGPEALERTKRLLDEFSLGDLSEDLTSALRHHMEARGSPEAKEGMLAFVEKRPPSWQTQPPVEAPT